MSNSNSKTYNFHVHGMHCNACSILIESELNNLPGVIHAKANLHRKSLEVIGDFGNKTPQEIADALTVPIKDNGYTLSLEKPVVEKKWSEFKIAVPVALGFLVLFIVLQKIGIINLVSGSNVTLGTAFVIGIIASLSTCMAVVGGLLLSMSATFAKEGERAKPQVLFHIGRLISFFILGGVIGVIGSAFTLNATATFVLGVIIGLVMLVLGINLLDVFHWSKKIQPSMPKFIGKYAHGISKLNHSFTPFLVGIATFFLPCGFTQSMQLYTLSTGSFMGGAMTMFAFALGTLPVLALISFSSFSIKNSSESGIFFKSSGLIVILFALFNIINSLAAIGIIEPLFNF
jgi:sulfite exporter TauE/SafE/copper chaperone CopZ